VVYFLLVKLGNLALAALAAEETNLREEFAIEVKRIMVVVVFLYLFTWVVCNSYLSMSGELSEVRQEEGI
jgi:hypothetical protein